MKFFIPSMILIIFLSSCSDDTYYKPLTAFDATKAGQTTDYSKLINWAAHPNKTDKADETNEDGVLSNQEDLEADVFFIHPTTLTGYEGETNWNADINDQTLNERTDNTTILFQASAFNKAGKVYAPRYQQAHIEAYYSDDKASNRGALLYAYEDVKAAFQYYLNNYNKGRPFILASHSQGTTHAKRLIKELIDGHTLQDRMIATYLVGIMVKKNEFENIIPCEDPLDTNCSISWRTFRKDVDITTIDTESSLLVTNPLTWKTSGDYADRALNKGGILRDLHKLRPNLTDAQVSDGILKASRPKFFGNVFFNTKNYHIADINFYYKNIQENAVARTEAYLKKHK